MDKLKLIKAVVCILTFLLVFGTLVLLGAIYKKTRRSPTAVPEITASLDQPAGSIVADYKIIGDEMYVLIKTAAFPTASSFITASWAKQLPPSLLTKGLSYD